MFDVETNGRFRDVPEVRVVRLAWALYDARGRERAFHDALVAIDVEIPDEAVGIHGITTEHARQHGRPLAEVLLPFVAALPGARAVVAHGLVGFDWPVVVGEIRRAGIEVPRDLDGEDTARMMWKLYPGQDSRLPDAHHAVVGRAMPPREGGIHDAAADVRACAALFFALRSRRRHRRARVARRPPTQPGTTVRESGS